MGRVVLLHLLGWCGTHYSTAATARMLAGKPSGFSQPPSQPLPMGTPYKELDKAAELSAAATRQRHSAAVRSAWTSGAALSFAALPWLGPAPALVCTLFSSLLQAEQFMPLWAGPAAPMVVSAATTACIVIGLGRGRGLNLTQAFAQYTVGKGAFSGAGDFHLELISAATFALGFRMWATRRKVAAASKAICGSVLWAATSALFITPLIARLIGLPPKLALMLSQVCAHPNCR